MFLAGTTVKGGFYFNRDKLDLVAVSGREGTLPGQDGHRFIRIPALAMLLLAPLLGGLFVVFLPLIGFALVLQQLGRLCLSATRRAVRGVLSIITPTWRPGEAYFAGKEGEKRQAKEAGKVERDPEKPVDK